MNIRFGRSKKFWPVWTMLLFAGIGSFPLDAANDNVAHSFLESPFVPVGCGVLLAVALYAGWRLAQQWRARVLKQRDEDIFLLINQWTKNLQDEVAQRKEAQRALQDSQDLTLRQERLAAVGQLAAGLAHEFNNILTVMQGHASLLMDDPGISEESKQSVTHVTEGVERITTLVKQMLAFSRKQFMQQRLLSIKESMDEFAAMLRRLIGAHIVLTVDIAPNLPPVMADSQMLEQILANLAVNARDVMCSGGHLTVTAVESNLTVNDLAGKADRRPGRFVQLSVADTGPGIDSSIIDHIFEPFFTTKDVGKGTGLGLATVYGMVKQHSGWIEVESMMSVGTTFHIFLPAAKEPMPEKPKAAAAPPAPAKREGPRTIMVVEDEEVLRELVREILEAYGYRVVDASCGVEALRVWENHRTEIDLLLTDMTLPDGMSGRDLAARIQDDNPHLPIIFSSGFSQEKLDCKEAALPGHSFLSKPYQPADLAQAVRVALDNAPHCATSMASGKA